MGRKFVDLQYGASWISIRWLVEHDEETHGELLLLFCHGLQSARSTSLLHLLGPASITVR